MRLVHLSDLHIGFRRYGKSTSAGVNQREADVAAAFRNAVDQILQIKPDLILVAGDVFHVVRPSNTAIIHAFVQLSRIRAALPNVPVVMVAGNHDMPRAAETGSILRLFAQIGVTVVDRQSEKYDFPELGLSVLAIPEGDHPAAVPDPAFRFNVLLLHGEIEGVGAVYGDSGDRRAATWTTAEIKHEGWTYVALGHYHVYRQVLPNAWYAGSIDYATANPWGDLREERTHKVPGKGFIVHNLETGQHEFRPIVGGRGHIDLPPLDGAGMSPVELNEAIAKAVARCPGGIDGKVVRLLVRNVPRHVMRELDHKAIREWKTRALHFHLDARKPELLRTSSGEAAPGGRRRRALADLVADALRARPLESGLDRDKLVQLALGYLTAADEAAEDPGAALGADDGALR